MWSREDDTKHGAYRSAAYVHMEGALNAKGGMTALRVKLTSPSVISRALPPFIQNGVDPFMVDGLHNLTYDVPNYEAEALIHEVGVRAGFYRSVGYSVNTYAIESFIDELALAAKVDPVAFRLTHLNGQPRAQAVLKLAAKKSKLEWTTEARPVFGRRTVFWLRIIHRSGRRNILRRYRAQGAQISCRCRCRARYPAEATRGAN
jgi:isoquinoline 1-oxidoreductase beta subunit